MVRGFLCISLTLMVQVALCQQEVSHPHQELPLTTQGVIAIAHNYISTTDIIYLTAQGYEAKFDLYRPAVQAPAPVVVYIHGGGWVNGEKEQVALSALPFMEMGFAVANVEYRLAKITPAPAAVEDCLCVLHWLGRHAK
jgi:acetyl esterase/lipase